MNLILFDCHKNRENLLPLTFTRPVADIRIGILTIRQKWEKLLGQKSFSLTEEYLIGKFPATNDAAPALYINGAVLPDEKLLIAIKHLGALQSLHANGILIAFKTEKHHLNYENFEAITKSFAPIEYKESFLAIQHPWDIFKLNGDALIADFKLLTRGRKSQPLSDTNKLIGPIENLFIDEGGKVEASILNTSTGPIYIGANAEIMEACVIRGPFSLGEHSTLKMAAKVYGPTTLGPGCKAGGEMSNVIFFGYSNKAHDGFLGNSVIGEWCNLGADTNNSNLKNNYASVDVFSYREGKAIDTGLTFCGLVMGDHSKCGINTMFNTGTVVGVSANIFGGDFPPKFIPSFSWGGSQWLRTFTFDKSLQVAERMMERRGFKPDEADIKILRTVFEREEKHRKNFK
ncbi:MAG: glucose-phosphate thymidylyltransferase [Bacteroidota bacterium]|nr:glucose-phosphate thymidylyltransferase [Bacteroidota bacterium]